jgi:hypothetical protein
MVGKTEVVVFNRGFEDTTLQDGSPSAANPELGSSHGPALPMRFRAISETIPSRATSPTFVDIKFAK